MDIQIRPTLEQLLLRARCTLRGHTWKRAKRFLGNSGAQSCKRCGAKRDVVLRPRRELTPKAGV